MAVRRQRLLPWGAGVAATAVGVVGVAVGLLTASIVGRAWPSAEQVAADGLALAAAELAPELQPLEDLPTRSRVVAADGTLLAVLDRGKGRDPVRLDDLPDHVVHAVLAAEDADFYDHQGVDVDAVGRAALRTLQGDIQGGSTITQQLVKLNFVGNEQTLDRKVDEALLAIRLEEEHTKHEILERYLNQVYFGSGAHGIGRAAATFFGVAATDLTPAQAATLAGKIRAPAGLDPWEHPEPVRVRRNQVLRLMHANGWLGAAEVEEATAGPLGLREGPREPPTRAPYFVEYVKRQVAGLKELGATRQERLSRLHTGGLVVETTLDVPVQRNAERVATEALGGPDGPAVGVASVQPGDGAIRVLVGGADFGRQKFDAATQIERQPGSVFKPFVYLAALRRGISPQSPFPADSPVDFQWADEQFTVHNYNGQDFGQLTVRDALVSSVNTVFMALALEVGLDHVVKAVEDAGIDKGINAYPSTSLGGINPGVSPLEMAAAFATFASGGVYAEPYAIARIRTHGGEVIYQHEPRTERRFDGRVVGALNDTLLDVVRRGTGRAAALDGHAVAGKTGTTSDNRDAWFVGFTRQAATAVWVGHLDNRSMAGVTGGSLPARIWHDVMAGVMHGREPAAIPTYDPAGLDLQVINQPPPPLPPPSPTGDGSEPAPRSTDEQRTPPGRSGRPGNR